MRTFWIIFNKEKNCVKGLVMVYLVTLSFLFAMPTKLQEGLRQHFLSSNKKATNHFLKEAFWPCTIISWRQYKMVINLLHECHDSNTRSLQWYAYSYSCPPKDHEHWLSFLLIKSHSFFAIFSSLESVCKKGSSIVKTQFSYENGFCKWAFIRSQQVVDRVEQKCYFGLL